MESQAEQDPVEQESNALRLSKGAQATSTPREFSPGSESSDGDFGADCYQRVSLGLFMLFQLILQFYFSIFKAA